MGDEVLWGWTLRQWEGPDLGMPAKPVHGGFSGGAVVKNPPANAGDTGLSPGPGRSHMPRSN